MKKLRTTIGFGAIGVCILFFSCVTTASINNERIDQAKQRATFDLECSKEKLSAAVISKDFYDYAETIGIKGCEKKAVYKILCSRPPNFDCKVIRN